MKGADVALAYASAHRRRTLRWLEDLVRIPSISADPQRATDVGRCAARLAEQLRRIGLDRVQVVPTARHPLVYGEWCRLPGRPTVLVYGHYDVQPVDPLEAWRTPPFEPTRRGDDLYGRGTSDDKGQLCAHLGAIEAWLRGTGTLPVNVRCLLDGEEEIGSPSLAGFLRRRRRHLAADVAVISDTRMLGPGRPAITVGLRGLLNADVEVGGPNADLHAGTFGGAVHNPLQALSEMVAGLHDRDGRVAIAGFYDRVRPWTRHERRALAAAAPKDAAVLRQAGVVRGWGEPGWTLHERTTLRPAVTINGIGGGYLGTGTKSVIPARAIVKIGIRLVPDQDPTDVARLLMQHLAHATPPTVRTAVRIGSRIPPAVFDAAYPVMDAASAACVHGFGSSPAFLFSGGTIPAAGLLRQLLGVPVVLLGLALPNDRAHAPNERFHLANLWSGMATSVWFLAEMAAIKSGRNATDNPVCPGCGVSVPEATQTLHSLPAVCCMDTWA
jgi:acetylornithine deacetylase/succinyl-diaminopimelate desuccinylase-like protein